MLELLALAVLLMGGLLVLGVIGIMLKLAFKLIALPFVLLGLVIKLALGLLLLPILGVVGLIAVAGLVLGGILAIVVPLLPLLLVCLGIYALTKSRAKPAVAPPA